MPSRDCVSRTLGRPPVREDTCADLTARRFGDHLLLLGRVRPIAAVGEAAALVAGARRLGDSVEAHELVHDHPAHLGPFDRSILLPVQTGCDTQLIGRVAPANVPNGDADYSTTVQPMLVE